MKTTVLSLLTLLLCVSTATAATEFYTLSFRDDPATTMVIGWSGDNGTVHYGTTDEGTNYSAYTDSHASDRTGGAHGITRHFARLTGLTPNTIYYFVIHDAAGGTSQRYYFRTLSDDANDPISFISGGDTRDGFKVFGVYVEDCPSGDCLGKFREGNQLVAKIRPDFIAFNGDFIMNQVTSNTTQEWSGWLTDWQLTVTPDGRMFPMTFTQGNHEDNLDMYELFDIPAEEYYVLNIHGGLMRLYMLNSELNACSNTAQLDWLTNDLQSNTGGASDPLWKFVNYHIPTYAMGNGYGLVSDQMTCWVNLFEQFGIKLVMESHTHITKWTYPCVANSGGTDFEVDNQNGIVYIGEGQWGAPHRSLDFTGGSQKPYVRDQDVFDNFFYIRLNQSEASIQCVKFENVSSVTASTSDALGKDLPGNAVTWNPSNGGKVTITNGAGKLSENTPMSSSVFPTVTSNTVNIEFGQLVGSAKIELYNSLGKLCTSEEVENVSSHEFDLKNACQGVNYIYIKTDDGKIESHRIVIGK